MKVIIICLSFTRTSQSRFCPKPVVRDSDTEHGPGDQGQFMGGNEHKSSFMEPGWPWRKGQGRGIHAGPPGPTSVPPVGLRLWRAGERPAGCCESWPNFKTPVWP